MNVYVCVWCVRVFWQVRAAVLIRYVPSFPQWERGGSMHSWEAAITESAS